MLFDLTKFNLKIVCENEITDAKTRTVFNENSFALFLTAQNDKPEFVCLVKEMDFRKPLNKFQFVEMMIKSEG